MNCPACNNLMIILEYNGVEIDYCPSCQGTWLDSGELELIMGNLEGKDMVFKSLKAEPSASEKLLRCPICMHKMEKVRWSDDKQILLDKCTQDHGLWFDKEELSAIIKLSKKEDSRIVNQLKEVFGFTAGINKPEE